MLLVRVVELVMVRAVVLVLVLMVVRVPVLAVVLLIPLVLKVHLMNSTGRAAVLD